MWRLTWNPDVASARSCLRRTTSAVSLNGHCRRSRTHLKSSVLTEPFKHVSHGREKLTLQLLHLLIREDSAAQLFDVEWRSETRFLRWFHVYGKLSSKQSVLSRRGRDLMIHTCFGNAELLARTATNWYLTSVLCKVLFGFLFSAQSLFEFLFLSPDLWSAGLLRAGCQAARGWWNKELYRVNIRLLSGR